MKLHKTIATIKVEALDKESVPKMIEQMLMQAYDWDCINGTLQMANGDRIEWETDYNNLER